MKDQYIRAIAEHFYQLKFSDLNQDTIHQAGRAFMDYLGVTAYSVHYKKCQPLVELFTEMSGKGVSAPFGMKAEINGAGAGAANAARTSSLELDDISGVNASVHAGVYVWSSAIEAYRVHPCSPETFIIAAMFGYDICTRLGLLAGENVRNYGLHGPGMCGAFAAAATASMIEGLDIEHALNALEIAGSLIPMCPFISFIEGSDSKDLYGGWGVYLGLMAVEAAKKGLTGPDKILEGPKGLSLFFASDRGYDTPLGDPYFINMISFKEFSGCFAVHPAITALMEMEEEETIHPEEIEHIHVETYPYSYALSTGASAGPLNAASARLSLPYTVSYALYNKHLPPHAFSEESMSDERYLTMMKRVDVANHPEYGESDQGIRGCIIDITLQGGRHRRKEVLGARWSTYASDDQLKAKFHSLASSALSDDDQKTLIACCESLSHDGSAAKIIQIMDSLN